MALTTIQALIPLGSEALEEALRAEATPRQVRATPIKMSARMSFDWGKRSSSIYLAD